MKPSRRMKHTDLFIVRVWTQYPDGQPGTTGDGTGWGGKVQRIVDGEAREFKDWEALIDALQAMLSASAQRSSSAQTTLKPAPAGEEDKHENNQSN